MLLKELLKKHFDALDRIVKNYKIGLITWQESETEKEKENMFFRELCEKYNLLKD